MPEQLDGKDIRKPMPENPPQEKPIIKEPVQNPKPLIDERPKTDKSKLNG